MTTPPDAEALLAPLKKKYIENISTQKEKLEKFLNLLQKGALTKEQTDELSLLAHSLSGSGATYGFPEVSKKAAELEKHFAENREPRPDVTRSYILQLIDTFSEIIIVDINHQEAALTDEKEKLKAQEKEREKLPLVVIADDDEMIRIMLVELLKAHARTKECGSAKEALDLMKSDKPDLVLLDDKMPGDLSGIELLEKIQNTAEISSIPIIMISANNDSKEILRGLMAGAVDYILKPINTAQVIARVIERLHGRTKSILIADDDVAIRNMLKHKLLSSGCRILLAKEGEQALALLKKHKPDLVILDRMMPGMDDISILKKIQEDPTIAKTPIIFLTAKHTEEDVIDGLNLGAIDYIVKPFNPAFVVSRCMRILKTKL